MWAPRYDFETGRYEAVRLVEPGASYGPVAVTRVRRRLEARDAAHALREVAEMNRRERGGRSGPTS
ncbi:hypothetical protein [Collinsella vaginalis]|uniref:hypothetical protein n=1 Tax=Collinsella vaginalis TaxID=1870987 RepID=UPI000A26DC57|nr:hypothetical protein [Collinsella vaginalis]